MKSYSDKCIIIDLKKIEAVKNWYSKPKWIENSTDQEHRREKEGENEN